MSIAELKIDLISRIANLKDKAVMERIKYLLDFEKDDTRASMLTKAQQEEVLHRSELYKQGKIKVYTLNEAKKRLKKISL
mgnify:CR=1 FL=1